MFAGATSTSHSTGAGVVYAGHQGERGAVQLGSGVQEECGQYTIVKKAEAGLIFSSCKGFLRARQALLSLVETSFVAAAESGCSPVLEFLEEDQTPKHFFPSLPLPWVCQII